jgi:hypothetical protein
MPSCRQTDSSCVCVRPCGYLPRQELLPTLIEALTEASIKRPDQPLLWLSQFVLEHSPEAAQYRIVPASMAAPAASTPAPAVAATTTHAPAAPAAAASAGADEGGEPEAAAAPAPTAASSAPASGEGGMLVGTKYRLQRVEPLGTAGTDSARALLHVLDLEVRACLGECTCGYMGVSVVPAGAAPTAPTPQLCVLSSPPPPRPLCRASPSLRVPQSGKRTTLELKQHESEAEAKAHVRDGLSISGTAHELTLAAPALIAALEDVGRRLQRAPAKVDHATPADDHHHAHSHDSHEGKDSVSDGKEADGDGKDAEGAAPVASAPAPAAPAPAPAAPAPALMLVGEEEGRLRAAVAAGKVKGVARGAKLSGHHYVVSIQHDGADVVIAAYDNATSRSLVQRVPPARLATLGLPPALLQPPNPDMPPSPADWDALFRRLTVNHATSPATLVLA